MKKAYIILMLLAGVLASTRVSAQYSEARFRIYEKGGNGNMYWPVENYLDSLVFVTNDYDVYVSAKAKITENAEWALALSASGAFSVDKIMVGVVPASYTEEEILSAYDKGEILCLQEWPDSATTPLELVLEDASYKPVAFGLDEVGERRSHNIGTEISISDAFKSTLLSCLMYFNDFSNHCNWGYGSIMHIRDVMGEEYTMGGLSGYDHYSNWGRNQNLGSEFAYAQFISNYFDNAIQTLSLVINRLDIAEISKNKKGKQLLASALAFRAMHYLDAARMYEYLPTDGTSSVNAYGNDVLNLTYPIGSSDEYANNSTLQLKRATRQEMRDFILAQLDRAQDLLQNEQVNDKELVNLGVVYGLKARLYMWIEDYTQAREYAQRAISTGNYTFLTEEEWHNPQTGFNNSQAGSWMWAMSYKEDCQQVTSGIINWVSWCSNQTIFGYTGTSTSLYSLVGASVYNDIPDTDFRKQSFKAPAGSPLAGKELYPSGINPDNIPELAALKFRPGQGNTEDYMVGAVVDVPLLRIEEMYFIACEAISQTGDLQDAKDMLVKFIKENRNPKYTCEASSKEEMINEVFRQKCVEFWGEGLNFFDYKRLNRPVIRSYEGSNFLDRTRFNTTTRPAWMNFVIAKTAYSGKLEEWNNPDPSGCYMPN